MTSFALALVFSVLILVLIFFRLRNSRMNERYATWWIVIALVLIIASVFPDLLSWVADVVGIEVPLNLAFFLAGVVVLLLSLQFSVDLSRSAERTRRLAEEIALLRARVDRLEEQVVAHQLGAEPGSRPEGDATHGEPTVGPDDGAAGKP